MNIHEFYASIGAVSPIERLGSEARIRKYLGKVLWEDESFPLLSRSLKNANYAQAFYEAHILRGICANLNFPTLYRLSGELGELLRSGNPDRERLSILSGQMETAYHRVMKQIWRVLT